MLKRLGNKLAYIIIGGILAVAGTVYAINVTIPQSTQKGDLPTGQTSGNYQLLHPGSDGTVLTSSSTSSNGLAWTSAGGTGTVTSVDMSVPTGLAISGNPITMSGTLALALQSGYNIPLTASTTNWNTTYNNLSSLTSGYIPYASSTGPLQNSIIYQGSGNVGVGTATPSSELTVVDNTNSSVSSEVEIRNWSTGNQAAARLNVTNNSGQSGSFFVSGSNNNGIGLQNTAAFSGSQGVTVFTDSGVASGGTHPFTVRTGGYNASNQRFIITSTGNVGIDDGNPQATLSVVGNGQIGFSSAQTAPANGLAVSGNVGIGTTSPSQLLTVGNNNQFTVSSIGNVNIATLTASTLLMSDANKNIKSYSASSNCTSGQVMYGLSSAGVPVCGTNGMQTALTLPLSIANGGTGTTTPALTQGSNISITGMWPFNTIALSSTPSVTGLTVSGNATSSTLYLSGAETLAGTLSVSATSTLATTTITQLKLGNGLANTFLWADSNGNITSTSTPTSGGATQWCPSFTIEYPNPNEDDMFFTVPATATVNSIVARNHIASQSVPYNIVATADASTATATSNTLISGFTTVTGTTASSATIATSTVYTNQVLRYINSSAASSTQFNVTVCLTKQ